MRRARSGRKRLAPIRGRSPLRFLTEKDFIEALKRSDELVEVPMLLLGDRTIIVPAWAVPYFAGLRFKAKGKPAPRIA